MTEVPTLSRNTILALKKRMAGTSNPASSNLRSSINKSPNARSRGKNATKLPTTAFHKFRQDDDLLSESLSFLHISDMMLYRAVCKRWNDVLGRYIRTCEKLVITARSEYSLSQIFISDWKLNDPEIANNNYVTSETVSRIFKCRTDNLTSLTINRIIINQETHQYLCNSEELNLAYLSVGLVKVTLDVLGATSSKEPADVGSKQILPFIEGSHLKPILVNCGLEIAHLELSLSIKGITPDFFLKMPRLRTFVPLHVSFVETRIIQDIGSFQGTADIADFAAYIAKFHMPDLLSHMRDVNDEALLLTDSQGNIGLIFISLFHFFKFTILFFHCCFYFFIFFIFFI